MAPPPLGTVLIALPGASQGVVPHFASAASGAIDLTTVAATADDHLDAAVCAQEKTRRSGLALVGSAQNRWTNATIAGILALHACPARVWGTASSSNRQVQVGAVLAL